MPQSLTYPGVYLEEISSGVRTITGVSTAATAFVDFFPRGPVGVPVRITSYADFARVFGGLDRRSEASFAIQQYYLNGGQVAWVTRLNVGSPRAAKLNLPGGSPGAPTLEVSTSSPGTWGNNVRVAVVLNPTPAHFDLFVQETAADKKTVLNAEVHRSLNMTVGSPRFVENVVNAASALVQLKSVGLGALPSGLPASTVTPLDSAYLFLGPAQDTMGTDGNAFDPNGNPVVQPFVDAILGTTSTAGAFSALDHIDPFVFNILCLPVAARLPEANMRLLLQQALSYCESKRAFLLIDIPSVIRTTAEMTAWMGRNDTLRHKNAAVYFPPLEMPDPLNEGRPRPVGSSGTVAGLFARTDADRGVWKAAAGTEAVLRNASPVRTVSDGDQGGLNPLGINVFRNFPIFGSVCWGARTSDGADQRASEWKYVPIRRTALYIEESLVQGLKWVVFEPNDEPLWSQIRLNVSSFLNNLFRQGAFQGRTPREAYFVKCDKETTTQADIDRGVVNIVVGFAAVKPVEFVVIQIQLIAGSLAT